MTFPSSQYSPAPMTPSTPTTKSVAYVGFYRLNVSHGQIFRVAKSEVVFLYDGPFFFMMSISEVFIGFANHWSPRKGMASSL